MQKLENVYKSSVFALLYFLLFLGEFAVYFITYSEALVSDSYYNLLVSSLWMLKVCSQLSSPRAQSKKSTFGWARIEGFGELFITTFASALFFSVSVNSIQKMFSADRKFFLHYEIYLVVFGIIGFLLHFLVYAIAGTDIKLNYEPGNMKKTCLLVFTDRFEEFITSMASSLLLLLCALINLAAKGLIKIGMVDGLTALIIVCMQLGPIWNMYQESGRILLQCIPSTLDIDEFKKQFSKEFPEVVNIHELHIWQLKEGEIVLTCHLVVNTLAFDNGRKLADKMSSIRGFFKALGATDITIQYEYITGKDGKSVCMVTCPSKSCSEKLCCIMHAPTPTL